MLTTFSQVAVGTEFFLPGPNNERYGPYTKTETRECEASNLFYASHGVAFYGWNATRQIYAGLGTWQPNATSLAPDEPVVVKT